MLDPTQDLSQPQEKKTLTFYDLFGSNYGRFSRPLAHLIGLHETIFLGFIIDSFSHFKDETEIIDGYEYIYATIEKAQEWTTLSRNQQDRAVKSLVKHGLIRIKVKGCPPKRYFSLIADKRNVFIEKWGTDHRQER